MCVRVCFRFVSSLLGGFVFVCVSCWILFTSIYLFIYLYFLFLYIYLHVCVGFFFKLMWVGG